MKVTNSSQNSINRGVGKFPDFVIYLFQFLFFIIPLEDLPSEWEAMELPSGELVCLDHQRKKIQWEKPSPGSLVIVISIIFI